MEVADRPDDEEKRADNITKGEALQMMASGESSWKRLDREPVRKERNKAIEGLEKFEKKTGLSTSKDRARLERYGNDPHTLAITIDRIKKKGTKHYKNKLEQSGAFRARGSLGMLLKAEQNDLIDRFANLDIYNDDEDNNMTDVLCDIDDMLRSKKMFMERYNRQSDYVKEMFDQMMPDLPLLGSKEKLLDKVLDKIGNLEDEPAAVQKAFKEKKKSIHNPEQLDKALKDIKKEYDKLNKDYTKEIMDNMDVFGGDMHSTPDGPMSTTAKEFVDEFRKRKSLAEMKEWKRKLPKYIKERQRLYDKRNELLEHAKPDDKARFERITSKMRRHELEAYLKNTLEPSIKKNNLMTAEFVGEIITARGRGNMDLYTDFERRQLETRFRTASLENQQVMLANARIEISHRRNVVDRYMGLPLYLRDDAIFRQANPLHREQMLADAEERMRMDTSQSPFEIDEDEAGETLSDTRIHAMTNALREEEGEKLLQKVIAQQQAEQAKEALELQMMTWNRVKHHAKEAEFKDETQKERFSEDLAYWTRKPEHLTDIKDAPNERMRTKVRFHEQAEDLYDKGFVTYSSGMIRKRQDITDQDLLRGNKELIKEKHSQAKYATDIHLMMADGGREIKQTRLLKRVVSQTLDKYIPIILEDVAAQMGLGRTAALGFINSDRAANNVQHYLTGSSNMVDEELMDMPSAA